MTECNRCGGSGSRWNNAAEQVTECGACPKKIRTWQERTGNHNIRPGSVKHMLAEIAELRAELDRLCRAQRTNKT